MPLIEHVVIAAAGLGSRLGHGIPKCLVEVEGRAIIERQLALVAHVPDVRVVVGYMEDKVIEAAWRVHPEAIIVRNPNYRKTTTQDSYALGAEGIVGNCLFLDADIIFDPASFHRFLDFAAGERLAIGITAAKTENAVFAVTREVDQGALEIVSFSGEPAPFEWANIVWAPANMFLRGSGAVFQTLQAFLPAPAGVVVSYEIDTEEDLKHAREFLRLHPDNPKNS